MANRFDTYEPFEDASFAQVRRAAAWDLGIVTLAFAVFWPMPLLRITLGLPWAIHVPLLVVCLFATWWAYAFVCAVRLRRTVGMYLSDVGFAGETSRPSARAGCRWALGWAAALLPVALGARGPADPSRGWGARLSGLALASTRGT